MFTYEELETVADLCKKYDILCISDEVYEHMVYDGNKHLRMGKVILQNLLQNLSVLQGGRRSLGLSLFVLFDHIAWLSKKTNGFIIITCDGN